MLHDKILKDLQSHRQHSAFIILSLNILLDAELNVNIIPDGKEDPGQETVCRIHFRSYRYHSFLLYCKSEVKLQHL